MTKGTGRNHTIIWSDPAISSQAIRTMSGLDYLRSLRDGRIPLPPMYGLFNFRFLEVEAGRVLFEAAPSEYHCNPVGIIHGGFACTVLDSATACAVLSLQPAGVDLASLEIKVNFVRPVKLENGSLRCTGVVIHAGQRIATAEGRLTDKNGNLYAHGVSTCLMSRRDS